jgi:Arc/MetJ-type ribon-helix-helix transcriptional regulator
MGVFLTGINDAWYDFQRRLAMHYEFPPDLRQRVSARLADGSYRSEDELLREAMNALDDLDREKLRLFHARNLVAEEQSRLGLSTALDLDAMLTRIEQRVAAEGSH